MAFVIKLGLQHALTPTQMQTHPHAEEHKLKIRRLNCKLIFDSTTIYKMLENTTKTVHFTVEMNHEGFKII